jgi:hypothetical protein
MSKLFEIQFQSMDKLIAAAEKRAELLKKNVEAAVAATVMWGAGRIAEDCPVDTGRLRASIGGRVVNTGMGMDPKAEEEGREQSLTEINGFEGVIGTNVFYVKFVEFGFTPRGPKELTDKQRRYLFAAGILKNVNGRVVIADVNRRINKRAGMSFRVKGKGFFRKNIPLIRRFFNERMEKAIAATLKGEYLPPTR